MSVVGSISIKDNATAVLRSIRNEQTSFRKDVEKTKNELKATWDKQYKAKIDATTAAKKANELKTKLEPLRKKVVTAVAVKDLATDKVKSVAKKVKETGKMVAKPVVSIAVKGTQALFSIGKGIVTAAKTAAVGISAVGAAGAAALKAIYNGSEEAAKAQIEAETKLEAVLGNVASIQERGNGAVAAAKQNLMGVASELQKVGVIGDEVTLAGMQQLATFQLSDKEISMLATGMTDLLAQQKGLNASQEDAVSIANMIGKAMTGQTSALSRVGITFSEAEKKALETGTAEERAAVLAGILKNNVGGVNKALAETDQGKIQQMANSYGDMKEEVGKLALSMKAKLASVVMKNIPAIQKMGTTAVSVISSLADKAVPILDKVLSKVTPVIGNMLDKIGNAAEEIMPVVSSIFTGLKGSSDAVRPVITSLINGFENVKPQLVSFGSTLFSTLSQVGTAAIPVIASIVSAMQEMLPVVIPVLGTAISTIGGVISAAAPVISGLVSAIGVAVTALAPVFGTIFSEIGEKVSSVTSFIGENMGFIQSAIETSAPVISDILSTAWSVISPVMDIAISVFKILFSVVKEVFPGIQAVVKTVWSVIKPIVEDIGNAVSTVSGLFGKVSDVVSSGGKGVSLNIGKNAAGDNNWRGGLTWVGEKGPELVDLPGGSRILPNKESVALTQGKSRAGSGGKTGNVTIHIAKIADSVVVHDEGDIDELANKVAKKIKEVVENM